MNLVLLSKNFVALMLKKSLWSIWFRLVPIFDFEIQNSPLGLGQLGEEYCKSQHKFSPISVAF
jgi:hypothetical protein